MLARSLRSAAAARISPRWVAAGSRLLHGETTLQRALVHRFAWTPAARQRARAVQVTSFSALDTLATNRALATGALDQAAVPYDAPAPAPMHRAGVTVAPADAGRARSALQALAAPATPGRSVLDSGDRAVLVFTEQAAGDLLLAGAELGCEVRLDGSEPPSAGGPRIEFPIDAVYTWVDGSDPAWQARLRGRQDGAARHALSANPSRFASRDELRYSLRSLEMYAGWVRHVFLVTDQQTPSWLRADHPDLTVVDHRDIFPADGTGLPTFNSHAIEARLHHVPGLADHYLYLNDDVFFGRPVPPERFFAPDGRTRFFPTPTSLDGGPPTSSDRPVDAAAKMSRQLIEREFGQPMTMKFQHVAHVQRRDVMTELEARFGPDLDRTIRQPFRHPDDVSAAASLAHYYGLATGRAGPGELSYLYCDIAERRAPVKLTRLARARDADMFCLNDVGDDGESRHGGGSMSEAERLAREFLAGYFPLPSRFESPGPRLMVFTSTIFVFAFLPLAIGAFYVVPPRWRAAPLLLMSAVFYAWGEPILVVLILLTALFTFSWGRLLVATEDPRARRLLLVSGIVVDLMPIAVFKYLDFALDNLGLSDVARRTDLPLPIGVSFYTFMAIGYLIDIYRRRDEGAPRLLAFSSFLTMFPHLIAGPIVRWYDIGPQLVAPRFDPGLFGYGALRVASGLAKKAVLADSIAVVVDRMFATGAPSSTGAAWVAAVLYSLQIYLDFSAYSDIAIGLAAMLGVRFQENFRFPYVARSAREFWQRWHISLGSWFRDYLYIPLGGSRVRPLVLWRNLLIVWGITGLWHGAAWTFVVWGLYFGVVIGLERSVYGARLDRAPVVLRHGYGLLVALLGWVLFRSRSLHQAGEYYRAMAGVSARGWDLSATYAVQEAWVLALVGAGLAAGAARPFMDRVEHALAGVWEGEGVAAPLDTATEAQTSVAISPPAEHDPAGPGLVLAATGVTAVLLGLATAFMIAVNYSPFIYFRF